MCVYAAWNRTAVADSTQVPTSSLDLRLNAARQRVPHIKVGILDIRCAMDDSIFGALAEWTVCDSVALITGWLDRRSSQVGFTTDPQVCTVVLVTWTFASRARFSFRCPD